MANFEELTIDVWKQWCQTFIYTAKRICILLYFVMCFRGWESDTHACIHTFSGFDRAAARLTLYHMSNDTNYCCKICLRARKNISHNRIHMFKGLWPGTTANTTFYEKLQKLFMQIESIKKIFKYTILCEHLEKKSSFSLSLCSSP